MRRIEADRARVAMMASYQAVTDDVGKLRDDELARPSRCQGWSLVLNPDGTTTAWNKDKTKILHSHGPPARAG